MNRRNLVAFVSGVIFAVGLCLSGMTNPNKVIGFLDIKGAWDPSLAFVMGGAIGVHLYFARWASRAKAPLLGGTFQLPTQTGIDRRLLAGASLFGVGWGMAGYCPGPAITSLVSLAPKTITFFGAMAAGALLARIFVFPAPSRDTATSS